MQWNRTFGYGLMLALAAATAAAPADAQKKEKHKEKHASVYRERGDDRPELRRRERDDDDDRDARWERERRRSDAARRERRDGRQVPPGWCQGRGNPHNTRENCGYSARRTRDGRWETVTRRDSRDGSSGRYASYEDAHSAFHRELDRRYTLLSAEHPTDLQYQIRLRAQKQAEHERWHERQGIGHDGRRI